MEHGFGLDWPKDRHCITRGAGTFLDLSIHSKVFIDLSYPARSVRRMSICNHVSQQAPTQNHLEFMSYLEYESLQSLGLVNKPVASITIRQDMYSALVNLENSKSRADGMTRPLLSCYGCLGVLSWGYMVVKRQQWSF